jgi:mannose-1-phosphate guanylyltransferase / mannose-6-phosphate isomerase
MTEGQLVCVPLGARHRFESPGELPMVLIEVQIGSYLGEADMIQYEDLYSQNDGQHLDFL